MLISGLVIVQALTNKTTLQLWVCWVFLCLGVWVLWNLVCGFGVEGLELDLDLRCLYLVASGGVHSGLVLISSLSIRPLGFKGPKTFMFLDL